MEQNQPIFTLQLNVDQVNVILSQVGKLPYETIAPLMETIRGQVNFQIQQLQEAAAAQQVTEEQTSEIEAPETIQ